LIKQAACQRLAMRPRGALPPRREAAFKRQDLAAGRRRHRQIGTLERFPLPNLHLDRPLRRFMGWHTSC